MTLDDFPHLIERYKQHQDLTIRVSQKLNIANTHFNVFNKDDLPYDASRDAVTIDIDKIASDDINSVVTTALPRPNIYGFTEEEDLAYNKSVDLTTYGMGFKFKSLDKLRQEYKANHSKSVRVELCTDLYNKSKSVKIHNKHQARLDDLFLDHNQAYVNSCLVNGILNNKKVVTEDKSQGQPLSNQGFFDVSLSELQKSSDINVKDLRNAFKSDGDIELFKMNLDNILKRYDGNKQDNQDVFELDYEGGFKPSNTTIDTNLIDGDFKLIDDNNHISRQLKALHYEHAVTDNEELKKVFDQAHTFKYFNNWIKDNHSHDDIKSIMKKYKAKTPFAHPYKKWFGLYKVSTLPMDNYFTCPVYDHSNSLDDDALIIEMLNSLSKSFHTKLDIELYSMEMDFIRLHRPYVWYSVLYNFIEQDANSPLSMSNIKYKWTTNHKTDTKKIVATVTIDNPLMYLDDTIREIEFRQSKIPLVGYKDIGQSALMKFSDIFTKLKGIDTLTKENANVEMAFDPKERMFATLFVSLANGTITTDDLLEIINDKEEYDYVKERAQFLYDSQLHWEHVNKSKQRVKSKTEFIQDINCARGVFESIKNTFTSKDTLQNEVFKGLLLSDIHYGSIPSEITLQNGNTYKLRCNYAQQQWNKLIQSSMIDENMLNIDSVIPQLQVEYNEKLGKLRRPNNNVFKHVDAIYTLGGDKRQITIINNMYDAGDRLFIPSTMLFNHGNLKLSEMCNNTYRLDIATGVYYKVSGYYNDSKYIHRSVQELQLPMSPYENSVQLDKFNQYWTLEKQYMSCYNWYLQNEIAFKTFIKMVGIHNENELLEYYRLLMCFHNSLVKHGHKVNDGLSYHHLDTYNELHNVLELSETFTNYELPKFKDDVVQVEEVEEDLFEVFASKSKSETMSIFDGNVEDTEEDDLNAEDINEIEDAICLLQHQQEETEEELEEVEEVNIEPSTNVSDDVDIKEDLHNVQNDIDPILQNALKTRGYLIPSDFDHLPKPDVDLFPLPTDEEMYGSENVELVRDAYYYINNIKDMLVKTEEEAMTIMVNVLDKAYNPDKLLPSNDVVDNNEPQVEVEEVLDLSSDNATVYIEQIEQNISEEVEPVDNDTSTSPEQPEPEEELLTEVTGEETPEDEDAHVKYLTENVDFNSDNPVQESEKLDFVNNKGLSEVVISYLASNRDVPYNNDIIKPYPELSGQLIKDTGIPDVKDMIGYNYGDFQFGVTAPKVLNSQFVYDFNYNTKKYNATLRQHGAKGDGQTDGFRLPYFASGFYYPNIDEFYGDYLHVYSDLTYKDMLANPVTYEMIKYITTSEVYPHTKLFSEMVFDTLKLNKYYGIDNIDELWETLGKEILNDYEEYYNNGNDVVNSHEFTIKPNEFPLVITKPNDDVFNMFSTDIIYDITYPYVNIDKVGEGYTNNLPDTLKGKSTTFSKGELEVKHELDGFHPFLTNVFWTNETLINYVKHKGIEFLKTKRPNLTQQQYEAMFNKSFRLEHIVAIQKEMSMKQFICNLFGYFKDNNYSPVSFSDAFNHIMCDLYQGYKVMSVQQRFEYDNMFYDADNNHNYNPEDLIKLVTNQPRTAKLIELYAIQRYVKSNRQRMIEEEQNKTSYDRYLDTLSDWGKRDFMNMRLYKDVYWYSLDDPRLHEYREEMRKCNEEAYKHWTPEYFAKWGKNVDLPNRGYDTYIVYASELPEVKEMMMTELKLNTSNDSLVSEHDMTSEELDALNDKIVNGGEMSILEKSMKGIDYSNDLPKDNNITFL